MPVRVRVSIKGATSPYLICLPFNLPTRPISQPTDLARFSVPAESSIPCAHHLQLGSELAGTASGERASKALIFTLRRWWKPGLRHDSIQWLHADHIANPRKAVLNVNVVISRYGHILSPVIVLRFIPAA